MSPQEHWDAGNRLLEEAERSLPSSVTSCHAKVELARAHFYAAKIGNESKMTPARDVQDHL